MRLSTIKLITIRISAVLIFLLVILSPTSALANDLSTNNVFFFETSTGAEIEVIYSNDDDNYTFVLLNKNNINPDTLLAELYNTAKNKQHYHYVQISPSCSGCQIESNPTYFSTGDVRNINESKSKDGLVSSNSGGIVKVGVNILKGLTSGIGTKESGEIMDDLQAKSSTNNPTIIVINSNDDGIPIRICAVSAGLCTEVDGVEINRTTNGGFIIEYPVPSPLTDSYRFDSDIQDALYENIQGMKQGGMMVICNIHYTDSVANLSAQLVCHLAK
jgi:hypothetical protein